MAALKFAGRSIVALAFALYAAFALAFILAMTVGLYAVAFLAPPD